MPAACAISRSVVAAKPFRRKSRAAAASSFSSWTAWTTALLICPRLAVSSYHVNRRNIRSLYDRPRACSPDAWPSPPDGAAAAWACLASQHSASAVAGRPKLDDRPEDPGVGQRVELLVGERRPQGCVLVTARSCWSAAPGRWPRRRAGGVVGRPASCPIRFRSCRAELLVGDTTRRPRRSGQWSPRGAVG